MPRVPDQLLHSVVYLFTSADDAKNGEGPGATGFLVDLKSEVGRVCRYLVTNQHVACGAERFVRFNTRDGADVRRVLGVEWTSHRNGNDVAVALMAEMPDSWTVTGIDWDAVCPTTERLLELNVGIGDDVVMVGRFAAHTGRLRNQPLARFGNIAMMPGEQVLDGRGVSVDAYLVEMRSLPGFSGSPVFLMIGPGSYRGDKKMMPFFTECIGLLGIDTGHKTLDSKVIDIGTGQPANADWRVSQNTGVAIVAPYTKVHEALFDDELVQARRAADKEWLEEKIARAPRR